MTLSGGSDSMGPHERLAACNAAANDAIKRADQCRAEGSSVGTREWMQAAAAALEAARLARDALQAIERGEAKAADCSTSGAAS